MFVQTTDSELLDAERQYLKQLTEMSLIFIPSASRQILCFG